jgi:acetyl-CoA carboxylase biotin carboxylase subunit
MTQPFRRVLVANRGEIAMRIVRACHEMGMEVVAVYSDADAHAAHVRHADAAVRLGPTPAAESYLRAEAVVAAALATGAEAIHPGYGFLSERASFAAAVRDAGLTFVGPSPEVIAALGDKLAARRTARAAGVPHVPGTIEPASVTSPGEIAAVMDAARAIGFPLLVKAAAGGGGRGMRRVLSEDELAAALEAGARESAAAFGDGTVYLEREILPARHVEVQLLGDTHGTVVALGERDCSTQRRHQKLIEEAPAPGLDELARRRLHAMAVRLAEEAGLANAATAEFLLDRDGSFWFLEVNTRLQVEHPVTELVSGIDIVQEQFRIAAGEPLSSRVLAAAERAARPTSHAIELRISAENPAALFAPAPGRVTRWVMPSGPGVRIDTAVETGDAIPSAYDPLIAKLVVHADDRPSALARLRRALAETEIGGVQTTLPFHRRMLEEAAFTDASDLSTTWVDGHWDGMAARASALRIAGLAAGLAEIAGTPADGPSGSGRATDSGTAARRGGEQATWRAAARAAATDRWPA